jgi:undecaprenyl-phosphate 4-deoxy-4-formamido-L-arabinose transferase
LGRYFAYGEKVAGFPFLASVLSIFSGVQLFSLGIIGEYLARMHVRLLDMPTYVARSISRKTPSRWPDVMTIGAEIRRVP